MIFGYHADGLPNLGPDQVVKMLDEAGYGSMALPVGGRWFDPRRPANQDQIDRFAELLRERNLASIIEIEPDDRSLISHDPTERHRYLRLCEYAIDTAATLRSDCVVLRSGVLLPGPDEEVDPAAAWGRLTESLVELLKYADERAVSLGLEPTPGMLIDTTDAYNRLLGRIDSNRLRLSLDAASLYFMGELPLAHYLHTWSGRLVNLYLCDVKASAAGHRLLLGKGELDFPPLFHVLDDTGYSGGVHVRFDRSLIVDDGLEEMRQSIRFLRQAARL